MEGREGAAIGLDVTQRYGILTSRVMDGLSGDYGDMEERRRLAPKVIESLSEEFDYMRGFYGIYSKGEVDNDMYDLTMVEIHQALMDERRSENLAGKTGDDFEYLFKEKAELNCWVGDFLITPASEFDDKKKKTDVVAEMEDTEGEVQRAALTIDCTTGADASSNGHLTAKLEGNFHSIITQKREVKYFSSQIDGYKGPLSCVPVVIGVERYHVEELMDHKDDNHFLSETPVQIAILREIKMQLEAYTFLLENEGEVRANYAYRQGTIMEIGRLSQLINTSLEEREMFLEQKGITKETIDRYLSRDKTYVAISKFAEMAKK